MEKGIPVAVYVTVIYLNPKAGPYRMKGARSRGRAWSLCTIHMEKALKETKCPPWHDAP